MRGCWTRMLWPVLSGRLLRIIYQKIACLDIQDIFFSCSELSLQLSNSTIWPTNILTEIVFFSSTTHVKNALYIFFSPLIQCKLHQKTNSSDLCWFILVAFENIKVYWQQYFKNCGLSFRKRNKDMTHNKPCLTSSLLLIFSC